MTTQHAIRALAQFLRDGVCGEVKYLRAMGQPNGEIVDNERVLAAPAVYEGTYPHRYASRSVIATSQVAPAIIVSNNGEASELEVKHGIVTMPVALHLRAWSPGSIDEEGKYIADECWQDIANFTDAVVQAVVNSAFPGGLNLTGNVNYSMDDFFDTSGHPFYESTITFSVTYGRKLYPAYD